LNFQACNPLLNETLAEMQGKVNVFDSLVLEREVPTSKFFDWDENDDEETKFNNSTDCGGACITEQVDEDEISVGSDEDLTESDYTTE